MAATKALGPSALGLVLKRTFFVLKLPKPIWIDQKALFVGKYFKKPVQYCGFTTDNTIRLILILLILLFGLIFGHVVINKICLIFKRVQIEKETFKKICFFPSCISPLSQDNLFLFTSNILHSFAMTFNTKSKGYKKPGGWWCLSPPPPVPRYASIYL